MTGDAVVLGIAAADGAVPRDAVRDAVASGRERSDTVGTVDVRAEEPAALAAATAEDDGPTAIVADGEAALRALARERPDAPILAVDADAGVPTVDLDALPAAIAAVLDGDTAVRTAPLLDVAVDGEYAATALRDATLATAEPARISEYAIEHAVRGRVDVIRADGVVVASPAGSQGYAAAGGGPILAPDTGLAVVPIAPFRVRRDRWVLPLDAVTIDVRRDEAAVSVEADGAVVATVGNGASVTLSPAGTVALVDPPAE